MFESITKKRKNPIINYFGWGLIAIVCVIFIFIGFSPDSSFLGSSGAAAEVNGHAISLRDFKQMVERMEEGQKAGDNSREARLRLQKQAIDLLVSRTLIAQEAEHLNIHVSDKEVADTLLNITPFHEDGRFSRFRYKTYLQQSRQTEHEFEGKIRRDLVIQKMSQFVGFAAKDLPLMDEIDKEIEKAKINVSYLSFNPKSTNITVDKEALKTFAADKAEKIKKDYENKKESQYTQKEQVKARHILVKTKEGDKKSDEEALKKIKEVQGQATPANFSRLAKEYSDDPGSKAKGGDLGFFPRGRMVPSFDQAAFTQELGKIGEPIKSKFGYHIILVDEKKEESVKAFDDVKDQIAEDLYRKEQLAQITENVKKILAEGNSEELQKTATQYGWRWRDTGLFSITQDNVPGVGNNKDFLATALKLTGEKPLAKQVVRKGDNIFVLKFKEAKLDTAQKKNLQMDFFKQFMAQQKTNIMIQNWTKSLQEKASVKVNNQLFR